MYVCLFTHKANSYTAFVYKSFIFFNLHILRHASSWAHSWSTCWFGKVFIYRSIGAFESSLPAETVTRCCIHTPSFAMTPKKKCGWRSRETVVPTQVHTFVFKFDCLGPMRRWGVCGQSTPRVCCCLVCLGETLASWCAFIRGKIHEGMQYICLVRPNICPTFLVPPNILMSYIHSPATCWYNLSWENVE